MNGGSLTHQNTAKILALDTSSPNVSLALCEGSEVISMIGVTGIAPHSRTIFRHMDYLLSCAETRLEQIDIFAIVTGPGSFTGLRVGISALKGIARGCGRPLVGVTAFDAWALVAGVAGRVAVLLEAGRGQVYFGSRQVDRDGTVHPLGADRLIGIAEIGFALRTLTDEDRLIITGNLDARAHSDATTSMIEGVENGRIHQLLSTAPYLARPAAVVAWQRSAGGEAPGAYPYYIKPADAEVMRGGER